TEELALNQQRQQEPEHRDALGYDDRRGEDVPRSLGVAGAGGARHERYTSNPDRLDERLDEVDALRRVAPGGDRLTAESADQCDVDDVDDVHDDERQHRWP